MAQLRPEAIETRKKEAALARKIQQTVNDTYHASPLNKTKMLQATCVIDVLYIVACLGFAIDGIYMASASAQSRCPDSTALGCAVEITNVISVLSWVARRISAAVSDCPQIVNQEAVCAADVTGMVADVTGIASAAMDVGDACSAATQPRPTEKEVEKVADRISVRRLQTSRHYMTGLIIEAHGLLKNDSQLQTTIGFSIATCVFDVIMAGGLLMLLGENIARATVDCPDPRACAVDMLWIIGAVSFTANTLSNAASDCNPPMGNAAAACAADITGIIANLNFLAAMSMLVGEDCNFAASTNDPKAEE